MRAFNRENDMICVSRFVVLTFGTRSRKKKWGKTARRNVDSPNWTCNDKKVRGQVVGQENKKIRRVFKKPSGRGHQTAHCGYSRSPRGGRGWGYRGSTAQGPVTLGGLALSLTSAFGLALAFALGDTTDIAVQEDAKLRTLLSPEHWTGDLCQDMRYDRPGIATAESDQVVRSSLAENADY